ncbi:UNVERIFIED_CONTAM: hypothetical protein Slati_1637300 [Sesamum latifolium]|uniref:Uncharacterized protein n=1 Tax=Sesamum latifolium TaxID=2727402 RepID=A0AAW2XC81_9LAMI
MESNRSKRSRSFSKSKLVMSLYRATKPSSAPLQQQHPYSTKPPKPTHANSSPASLEFLSNQPIKPKAPPAASPTAGSPVGFLIVKQEQVFPQQTPKLAFVVTERKPDSYRKLENFYGGVAEDDGVDDKAAKYISSVRERRKKIETENERTRSADKSAVRALFHDHSHPPFAAAAYFLPQHLFIVFSAVFFLVSAAPDFPGSFWVAFYWISIALMLFGSVTFVIGLILMPLVITLVLMFYVVGIVSNLSEIGRDILWPSPDSIKFEPDVNSNGNKEDGDYSSEDDGVDEYGEAARLHVGELYGLLFPGSWKSSPGDSTTNNITAISTGAKSAISPAILTTQLSGVC